MADDYVWTLDEASLKVAKEELGEDPKERLGQVETFRQWIKQQPHIKCNTDTPFLLRFLRTAKFSQLEARKRLEKFLMAKMKNPDWLQNVDVADPKILKFMEDSTMLYLPDTPDGKKAVIVRIGSMETTDKNYTKFDTFRAMSAIILNVLADEKAQINGVVFLFDYTNVPLNYLSYYGVFDLKRCAAIWEGAFPARFKGIHFYNMGSLFEVLMSIIKPVLSKKTQKRVHMHGTMETAYKTFPMSILPEEYLPDDYTGPNYGSVKDVTAKLIKTMLEPEVRSRILLETGTDFAIDVAKQPEAIPQESFRKLNVT